MNRSKTMAGVWYKSKAMELWAALSPVGNRHAGRHYVYTVNNEMFVGYGHSLRAAPLVRLLGERPQPEKASISESEAFAVLREDAITVGDALDARLPWWRRTLNEARQAALVGLCLRAGVPAVASFDEFTEALRHEDWDEARSLLMRTRWGSRYGRLAAVYANQIGYGKYYDEVMNDRESELAGITKNKKKFFEEEKRDIDPESADDEEEGF